RAVGYPVWASDITPVTGKWRIETVEINGPVQIGHVRVSPGDLVVADDTGVCFIPRDVVLEVLEAAERKAAAEDIRCKAIDDGIPVPDIPRAGYGEKKETPSRRRSSGSAAPRFAVTLARARRRNGTRR